MAQPRSLIHPCASGEELMRHLHQTADGTIPRFAPQGTLGNRLEAFKRSLDQAEIG